MRSVAIACLLAFVLAGCAGSPDEPAADDQQLGEDVPVEVTATTGAIRGVVVDDAIRPLANVQVKLVAPARYVNTTETGTFSFSGLEPGTYFVEASKMGFKGARQSVDVVAGDEDPPVTRVLLTADATMAPYATVQKGTGIVVCGTSVVAACGAAELPGEIACDFAGVCVGSVTGDKFGFYIYYEANATMIQSEMFWTSTQALSTELSMEMENIAGCEASSDSYVESVEGNSPIYNIANASEIQDGTIGGTCGIWYSIFSGGAGGSPVGITVQQQFEIYSHAFYGYTPKCVGKEGWRFSEDPATPAYGGENCRPEDLR